MPYRTRSGKLFKPASCCDQYGVQQCSPWGQPSNIITEILPGYLHSSDIRNSRAVCYAWKQASASHIYSLRMVQPLSQTAARARGRKAAAAFPNATMLHLELYHADPDAAGSFDLTGYTALYMPPAELVLRPLAAAALLRPFKSISTLRRLQLSSRGQYSSLARVLPTLPGLQCLDLSGCCHLSSDLITVATHLQHMQKLVLCNNDRIRVCYEPQHIEALGCLPRLQQLQIVLSSKARVAKECWAALGTLTALTSLHALTPAAHYSDSGLTPASAVTGLAPLTGLKELKCRGGLDTWGNDADALAKHWTIALQGMTTLQEVELCNIIITDALLQGFSALQQLHKLVLDVLCYGVGCRVTAAGAAAVAHIPHIEVLYNKGVSCKYVKPLLQLPALKRLMSRYPHKPRETARWTQEGCICDTCFWNWSW